METGVALAAEKKALLKVGRSMAVWIQAETEAPLPFSLLPVHVHTPSPHKDVLITHSLCRVGLSENHLFLAGSKLAAAPGLILCQQTQEEEKSW